MTAATSRIIIGGRVEHIDHAGQLIVTCRAGCFERVVTVPPVPGIDIGDEVIVELDYDLRHGVIRRAPPRQPFRHQQRRRERST